MTGRCFSSTAFPLRQRRRISNLVCVQPAARVVALSPRLDNRGDATRHSLAGSPRRRRAPFETPVAASLVAALLPTGQPGGGVLGRRHPFISLGRQSANYAAQHFTESFGPVAPQIIGFAHAHNMRESHAESVAPAYVNERG